MEDEHRCSACLAGGYKGVNRVSSVSLEPARCCWVTLITTRMLAVMTFNLGFLLVVILGIVVGELILGRYISGTGWEEGGCHDG